VFLTFTNVMNIIRQSSIYGIMAIGMTFVILTAGIDLSVGSLLAISGAIAAGAVKAGLGLGLTVPIALAIGLDNELHLPVVRDVEKKDLVSLQKEVADLVAKVKARTLRADQMSGGSMALSNLGMYPIEAFDAIIFPEHSTILTLGAIQLKPVILEGEVKARPLVTVKLAADHRLINGRTAAAFLSRVKEVIESGEIF